MTSDQQAVFELLGNPGTHGLSSPVKRIDTHAAVVFLAGSQVYKVKRAVHFPFMDQSSLEKRRVACEAEVTVNRRYAPDIYLGVVPIVRAAGALQIGGEGEIVEWAVHLRRFNENDTFDHIAERGELDARRVADLAAVICASHEHAERRDRSSATDALSAVVDETAAELIERRDIFDAGEAAALAKAMRAALDRYRPLLLTREASGRVRRCHGDLHLRNIVLIDGRPVLFDAIEFDEAIATTDVLYDLAFLLMDLWERGFEGEANLLLNRYLWAQSALEAELAGLAAMPLFLSLRAAVRAKVAALRPDGAEPGSEIRAEALRYFAAASAFLKPAPPRLVAIGGLSGTGKSTLSARLAPNLGRAPGAIHLRSDIERKRLLKVDEQERLGAAAYTPEVTNGVFANLRSQARSALAAGQSVIVDAVHLRRDERLAIGAIAAESDARFSGLWLEAPIGVLTNRVAARHGDASDATAAVVAAQASTPPGAVDWSVCDATGEIDDLVARASAILAARA